MTGEGDKHGAARLVAINPKLRAECETFVDDLEAARQPIDPTRLMQTLVLNAIHFSIPDQGPEVWASLFKTYIEALGKLPEEAILTAWLGWHQGKLYTKDKEKGRHAFMPKPAELYALAEPVVLELGKAHHRARLALEHVEKAAPKPRTAEERARDREELIRLGVYNADGTPNLTPRKIPEPVRIAETPQQVAGRIIRTAPPPSPPPAVEDDDEVEEPI